MRYRYSYRDGSADRHAADANELMDALADDLIAGGDVWQAVQRVTRWGAPGDGSVPGVQDLLDQVRVQRQELLDRYDPGSVVRDLESRLQDAIGLECDAIEQRLAELPRDGSSKQCALEAGTNQERRFLHELPDDPGDRLRELCEREFLDEGAREAMEGVRELLRQHALGSLADRPASNTTAALPTMLQDLNQLLEAHSSAAGSQVSSFLQQYGMFFPGAATFDGLVDQLLRDLFRQEAFVESLPGTLGEQLLALSKSLLQGEQLRTELTRLQEHLRPLDTGIRGRRPHVFGGHETVSLRDVRRILDRLFDLDRLEMQLREAMESANVSRIDDGLLEQVLGPQARQVVSTLTEITGTLEDAGYIDRPGNAFEVTARGIRRIGDKALRDIFRDLTWSTPGGHPLAIKGTSADRGDETKRYEFGDPFLLDMGKSLHNAVLRNGSGTPLKVSLNDFEVYTPEHLACSATVLMLDMSRSMPLRGCFAAAKKVAFALNSLIRSQFPRDTLSVIVFSEFAREISPEQLHRLSWGDAVYGTNMQHGFRLARRLLALHRVRNKQIILITDGEPTAHFEGDRVHFSYPPTIRTFQETLREVKRCSQDGIVINTFMLDRSQYLAEFISQMTRLNRGRAFFTSPERLGDYILVDYVAGKRGASHSVRHR